MAQVGVAQVWRVDEPVRRLALVVSIFFVVVAVGSTVVGLAIAGDVVMWTLALVVVLSVWRWYIVPYVVLTSDRVVVRGVFARRTVGYGAIRQARPGLYGLRIETEDQGAVTVWAVQKSKFSEWTHRHTRADDVVAEIMDRVHDVHDAHDAHDGNAAPAR
ncbi:MAG TPA: PH domain-containing protein [Acidimicrobiales bacterium]|nr:PH domain-containing protein [Acidimicrobiales bacterium]